MHYYYTEEFVEFFSRFFKRSSRIYTLHKRRKQAFTCLPGQPEENLLILPSTHLEKKTQTFEWKHSSSKDTEFREFIENESSDIDLETPRQHIFVFTGPNHIHSPSQESFYSIQSDGQSSDVNRRTLTRRSAKFEKIQNNHLADNQMAAPIYSRQTESNLLKTNANSN